MENNFLAGIGGSVLFIIFVSLVMMLGFQCGKSFESQAQNAIIKAEQECQKELSKTSVKYKDCIVEQMYKWSKEQK